MVVTNVISSSVAYGWILRILLLCFFSALLVCALGTNISISDMAVDVWGQLAKAQDDSTTIDEAIADAISEHEADPDSHLGVGESLQSHRAEEIIDHVVGSVLADKMSNTEGIYESIFESLDQWNVTGEVTLDGYAKVVVYADGVASSHSQIYAGAPFGPASTTLASEYLFQTVLDVYYDDDTDFNFGIGYMGTTPQNHSLGFYFDGTNWKAYYRNGSTTHYSGNLSISNEQQYVFRIHNVAGEKTLRWYINGVIVWEYEYTDDTEVMNTFLFYDVNRTAGEAYLDVNKVMCAKTTL